MAWLDDEQRSLLVGIAIGVGATLAAKTFAPAFRDAGRPLAKAALKSGILAFEKTRETLAEWSETVEDLVAEVRSEMEQDGAATAEAVEPPLPQPKPN